MKSIFGKICFVIAASTLAFASHGVFAAGSANTQPASGTKPAQSQQSSVAAAVGWAIMSHSFGIKPPTTENGSAAKQASASAKPAEKATNSETTTTVHNSDPSNVTAHVEETSKAPEPAATTSVTEVKEHPKVESSPAVTAVSVTAPAAKTAPSPAAPQSSANARADRIVQFAHEKAGQVSPREKTGSVKMGFSVILKLILVLGLAYLSILALKLLSTKRGIVSGVRQDLRVTDTIKLTPTNSLHMVEINGKKILVGSSSGQVNLLREFEEEEIPQEQPATEGRFSEYLSKYSGLSNEKTPAGRVAGLLRDCATHLKNRQDDAETAYQIVAKVKDP